MMLNNPTDAEKAKKVMEEIQSILAENDYMLVAEMYGNAYQINSRVALKEIIKDKEPEKPKKK